MDETVSLGLMMYRVEEYHGSAALLAPIAESWRQEANGASFGLTIDTESHLQDLQRLIQSDDSAVLILVQGEKELFVIGYMGLQFFKNPLGPETVAQEHYWYVLPEKRGKGSLRLLSAADEWAKRHDCSHLIMNASHLASDSHDKVCRLYERKGYQPFETSFIKEL